MGPSMNEGEFGNNSQQNELIDYIINISNCHLDESNPKINLDLTETTLLLTDFKLIYLSKIKIYCRI